MTNAVETPSNGLELSSPGGSERRQAKLPTVSPVLARLFQWYVSRYLRRHFNAVRVARQTVPDLPSNEAIICFGNHPGWWDPLIALLLNQLYLDGRTAYAPIEDAALNQYPIFRKLGFFGIDLDSLDGARRFLAVSRELLRRPTTALWVTPGGKFADVRTRTRFQTGLGHLAASVRGVTLLPVALEYTFWEERTPETLVEFGAPVSTAAREKSKGVWQRDLEDLLAAAQARLATKAIMRRPDQFDVALEGRAGIGGWYDFWRRAKSTLTGGKFDPRHGQR